MDNPFKTFFPNHRDWLQYTIAPCSWW